WAFRQAGNGLWPHRPRCFARGMPDAPRDFMGQGGAVKQSDSVLGVEAVSKTYDNGFTALRDVSLALQRGQSLVVVGGSGSGKSTLLRCIAGLEQPDQGRIAIDGKVVFDGETRLY